MEAIEMIALCLENVAFYYYVQRRALVGQEIEMFDTKVCQTLESSQVSLIIDPVLKI